MRWWSVVPHMSSFLKIDVRRAEPILSPACDVGFTEEELRQANLAKLNALQAGRDVRRAGYAADR